jgi:hypothetical protein
MLSLLNSVYILKLTSKIVRFQVLMVMSMKMRAFWDMVLCSFVEVDWLSRGTYCPNNQGDGGGSMHLSNVTLLLWGYMAVYCRRLLSLFATYTSILPSYLLPSLSHGHLIRGFLTEICMLSLYFHPFSNFVSIQCISSFLLILCYIFSLSYFNKFIQLHCFQKINLLHCNHPVFQFCSSCLIQSIGHAVQFLPSCLSYSVHPVRPI